MKKTRRRYSALLSLLLAVVMLVIPGGMASATGSGANYDYDILEVGNPTPLTGRFFTTMWGGTTSDVDVQHLLHGYTLTYWDEDLGRFRINDSIVKTAIVSDGEEGDRTYFLLLRDDLQYSDGSEITAWDYAFTLLFQMEEAIRNTGGIPIENSWILGAEAYRRGEAEALEGLRILGDHLLCVTASAESLPNFYEMGRLSISPWPISELAPGNEVLSDETGAWLKESMTVEEIQRTVLDEKTGYMVNPKVVSGPYTLESYDGTKATFLINPYYKGDEDGIVPTIEKLTCQVAENGTMIGQLQKGEFGLLNKVTYSQAIWDGLGLMELDGHPWSMSNYPRTGLATMRFQPDSPMAQEEAVRKAIILCMDREAIVRDYVGPYGMVVDGLYGLGEWQTRLLMGTEAYPLPELSEKPTEEELEAYEAAETEWHELSLKELTHYTLDVDAAIRMLEAAGWKADPETGIRRKQRGDGSQVTLEMRVAIPENEQLQQALETHWLRYLARAGIQVELIPMDMLELANAYRERARDNAADKNAAAWDMILVGDDFAANLELQNSFRVAGSEQGVLDGGKEDEAERPPGKEETLEELHRRLYDMAAEVNHTEPEDVIGYMRKWIDLQEEINSTVPFIPLYSNVYFDFFTRNLHAYDIESNITWADAIVQSWMSDTPNLADWEKEEIANNVQSARDAFNMNAGPDEEKEIFMEDEEAGITDTPESMKDSDTG